MTTMTQAETSKAAKAANRFPTESAILASALTPASLKLFLEYADDAGNWNGTPLVGGNVGGSARDRGNLTHLKISGLITTDRDEGCTWVSFTAAGIALAALHGITI